MLMKKWCVLPVVLFAFLLVSGCARTEEMTLEEIDALLASGENELLSRTVSKPWRGEEFVPGVHGGVWNASVSADPKSFNLLVAERDGSTAAIVAHMHDGLLDYNYVTHEFVPHAAEAEIEVHEDTQSLSVIFTLRDDLYWSFYNSDRRVKVTSDDVIFWYDEIQGDPAFQSSAYNSQFLTMPDGSQERITIRKIDDRRFAFEYPRIEANPFLASNMSFGPKFIFEKAKKEGGVQGVLDVFGVNTDPKTIPSMGLWFLTEYSPGQRLVFERNPAYWRADSAGGTIPYPDKKIVRIIPEENTQKLLFGQGQQDSYGLRPEDLEEMVGREDADYTVFSGGGSLGASFWSFNQNPKNAERADFDWFTRKEFRQAMSCLVNRERMIAQTYRGLAVPKLSFFAEPNPFYNPALRLEYLYDPERAVQLLASIGMSRDADGVMRDVQGREVEFDLTIPADNAITNDLASIIVDEAARVGVRIRIRATDFQKVVEQLTSSYDWQSVIIGLGANYWPTQGSNVWPSTGNLHLWHPLQESPATDWEARIDYLYNEGRYTLDRARAERIWNEYQALILEQCPLIYLVRPRMFTALRNRWDFTNVYYDNIGGLQLDYAWLRPEGMR
jgi:peptide/nickel transport system substrate-binding protein